MIDRRLALLLAAAIGIGGYAFWSGDSALMTWLYPQEEIVTAKRQPALAAPSAAESTKPTNLNPLAGLAMAQFGDIVKRPLFNPTRAPAPPPPEPEPEPDVTEEVAPPQPVAEEINPDDFTILGIASKDGIWTVVMRWKPSNEIHRLRAGGEIQGWNVAEVSSQKITLSRNGKTLDIKMFQNLASRPAESVDPDEDPAENPEPDVQQRQQINPQPQGINPQRQNQNQQ